MYGLETVALTKRLEREMDVAGLNMLRFVLGVMRMDKTVNEYIRGIVKVTSFRDKVREMRLRLFGHVQRRMRDNICKRTFKMELSDRGQIGRPKRKIMDF